MSLLSLLSERGSIGIKESGREGKNNLRERIGGGQQHEPTRVQVENAMMDCRGDFYLNRGLTTEKRIATSGRHSQRY